mgnify:CR=1 FL=1
MHENRKNLGLYPNGERESEKEGERESERESEGMDAAPPKQRPYRERRTQTEVIANEL